MTIQEIENKAKENKRPCVCEHCGKEYSIPKLSINTAYIKYCTDCQILANGMANSMKIEDYLSSIFKAILSQQKCNQNE